MDAVRNLALIRLVGRWIIRRQLVISRRSLDIRRTPKRIDISFIKPIEAPAIADGIWFENAGA
jgi:hypothetical protein